MQTTRTTRSSVLGKRTHQQQDSFSSSLSVISSYDLQLQTPDPTPNPKRIRTSITAIDGDSNKENVPPFSPESMTIDPLSPRATRALRRMTTELITTPSCPRTMRRHASPTTPTPEISHLAIATPPATPPTVLLSVHARARALLRPTCNSDDTEIAGRDAECAVIQQFLTSFLDCLSTDDEQSTSLYISGSPGSGKTALVNSILRSLNTDVKVICINCMALNSLDALWERLLEDLHDGSKRKAAGKVKGREAVEALLSNRQTKCIVLLDELDHITPNIQSLSSVFSLPNATPSTLRLIGIANTHTLTSSSSSMSSITAASNVRTLHFAPYTPTQLHHILQSRLKTLYESDGRDDDKNALNAKKFLSPPTLMLLTKKIAALTGDVRSLFEVLRSAIDLAIAACSSPPNANENPLNPPSPSVSPTHILAALKAYTPSSTSASTVKPTAIFTSSTSNSEIVAKVHNLGLQARLVLLCILLASKRVEANLPLSSSTPSFSTSPKKKSVASPIKRSVSLPNPSTNINGVGIDPNQLHAYYSAVLNRNDSGVFDPVSRSEFGDLVGVLEGVGLVCLAGGAEVNSGGGARRAFGRSASFGGGAGFGGTGKGKGKGAGELRLANGVRVEEVLRAMGVSVSGASHAAGDIKGEEVRGIWERETSRLGRDLKALGKVQGKSLANVDGFHGATED
ncbi:P-loop containing nucleoside triphosphate hydrolase protein [Tricholoma matsutake]|nr:P-loop containing nucleoside triphosphate hydrolase protein [Tricholoma matsutake 945]